MLLMLLMLLLLLLLLLMMPVIREIFRQAGRLRQGVLPGPAQGHGRCLRAMQVLKKAARILRKDPMPYLQAERTILTSVIRLHRHGGASPAAGPGPAPQNQCGGASGWPGARRPRR